jgi:hypothetical protein
MTIRAPPIIEIGPTDEVATDRIHESCDPSYFLRKTPIIDARGIRLIARLDGSAKVRMPQLRRRPSRRQSTFSLHSERRRRNRCPQRWSSISDIADATRLTSDSLLTFLLHSPHPAFVRVIEDTLYGPGDARCIGIVGAPEGHQRDRNCQSS